jgi:hypothetical protein
MRGPPPVDRPLTAENLLRDFGDKAAVTRDGVRTLFDALDADQTGAIAQWMAMFGRWAGRAIDKLPQHLARLAARYGIAADGDCPNFCASENGTVPFEVANAARLLFAVQTYYALLVNHLAERFGHGRVDGSLPGNPFSWCDAVRSQSVDRLMERLAEVCGRYRVNGDCPNCRASENGTVPFAARSDGECDLFKPLYQSLFPRPLRRQLGEYYTPDWLAAHVLDQVGYTGQPGRRLLDPACGSGTFLLMALRRWLKNDECKMMNDELSTSIHHSSFIIHHSPIVGFDLNPLAVMTARANFLIALADVLPEGEAVEAPIYLYDSILGQGAAGEAAGGTFDFVVGNPPWIAWDNLPDDDRQATKPLWERYGLFSLSGNAARHGGGKKDLSMLMLYAAADRFLKPHGRLGMVITQTLFQTKGAGDGFRRFRLGADGPPLRVIRVDDMVALRPFGDAANWTSTIVLEKDAATEYPVPYFQWRVESGEWRAKKGRGERGEGRGNDECGMMNDEWKRSIHHSSFIIHHSSARPVDPAKPTSPWLISGIENSRGPTARGALERVAKPQAALPADYVAHLGANSGGANGVYWVEVLRESDGGVLVRNLAGRGKHRIETVECVIEPDLLYPLLRWGDVARYSAKPAAHLLLTQDPATRSGIDESVMRAKYPRTLAYLERFRELLAARAAYRRYQQSGPFYAMYNVGPYTVAPIKVVWRRMDRRINAAVVESCGAGVSPACWGGSCTATPGATVQLSPQQHLRAGETPAPQDRPPIPQETCVLVACDSSHEAHYLCAMLNSAVVNARVAAHSVRGGKGFGTPGMFDFLPLRRYRPDDPRHAELAELSRGAHAATCNESPRIDVELLAELQQRIDELASASGW